jgi:hypothetical protein
MKLPKTFHMVLRQEKKDQGRNISRSRRRFHPNRVIATARTTIPTNTVGFLIIRLPTHRIMPKKVVAIVGDGGAGVALTVTCAGWACAAAGDGDGRVFVNRAKRQRWDISAVTVPVWASYLVGRSCHVPVARS